MIDHVSIGVGNLERAVAFYQPVLAAIGLKKLTVKTGTVGFGKTYPEFWLNQRNGARGGGKDTGVHVCLRARTIAAVTDFHATALKAGATSDGAPGPRPDYGARYFAAFIRDVDGNRIEAVTFTDPA